MKSHARSCRLLSKFRHFESFADLRCFASTLILWGVLPLLLLFPLKSVLRLLTPRRKITPSALSAARQAKIERFAHYWFSRRYIAAHHSCLKQSLVLYYLFNRAGIPARICFGIRKEDSQLSGHSWIETPSSDRNNPDPHNEFVEIYAYPERPVGKFYTCPIAPIPQKKKDFSG